MAGLEFMYGPSLVHLMRGIWSSDEHAQGTIVLGVSCWLVWRNWPAMWARSAGAQTSAAGWPVVVVSLLLYIVGRLQGIQIFEVGSLIWLLTGVLLLTRGGMAVKTQLRPLFLMLFTPGTNDRKVFGISVRGVPVEPPSRRQQRPSTSSGRTERRVLPTL